MDADYRVFSFGGGVQSVAVMVLQIQGMLPAPFDEYVFANVGDDSESPDTLTYMDEVIVPLAQRHGVTLTTVQKTLRGKPETLLQSIVRDNATIPIPVHMQGGSKSNRTCTIEWKVRVVDKYIRAHHRNQHVEIGIGFSTDETRRLNGRAEGWNDRYNDRSRYGFWKRFTYPLLELGTSRTQAKKIITDFGLPEPARSACWFCPFLSRNRRIEQKRNEPHLWQAACELEDAINEKRRRLGRDDVYLHPDRYPISEVPDQMTLYDAFEDDLACGEGYCGL